MLIRQNKVEKLTQADFKTYCKTATIKTMLLNIKLLNWSMEQYREPKNRATNTES
jgi:hypothetical protein